MWDWVVFHASCDSFNVFCSQKNYTCPVYNLPIAYFLYVHVNEKSFQPMGVIPTPNA